MDIQHVRFKIAFLFGAMGTVGTLELRRFPALLAQMQTEVAFPAVHFAALLAGERAWGIPGATGGVPRAA